MDITVHNLLFCLLSALIAGCITVLFFNTEGKQARLWYGFFLLSFIAWISVLLARPGWGLPWLYLLPVVWIPVTFRYSIVPIDFRGFNAEVHNLGTGEPRHTQESLRGPAGTREALSLHFALTLISLLIMLILFYSFYSSF